MSNINILQSSGYSKVSRLAVLVMALPIIFDLSLNALVGLSDNVMIGRFLGKEALSAAGYSNMIFIMIILLVNGFNTGVSLICARHFGARKFDKLKENIWLGLIMNLFLGLLTTIFLMVFMEKLISLFDVSSGTRVLFFQYLQILNYGLIFFGLNLFGSSILRSIGQPKLSLLVNVIVVLMNILGNYVLITGFLFFPKMGIEGAAISSVLSKAAGTVLYMAFIFVINPTIKIKFSDIKVKVSSIIQTFRISIPAMVEEGNLVLGYFVILTVLSQLPTESEAALQIVLSLESFILMPIIGFSISVSSLTGIYLGKKEIENVKYIYKFVIKICLLIFTLPLILLAIFAKELLTIYTTDISVIEVAITPTRIMSFVTIFLIFVMISSGLLKGAGATMTVFITTLIRQWLIVVPLSIIAVKYLHFNIEAMWISELIAYLIFSTVLYYMIKKDKWTEIGIN